MFDGEFDVRGESLVVARSSLAAPGGAVCRSTSDGSARPLTRHNAALLSSLDLAKPESFTFAGAGGTEVQGFLVQPAGFDAVEEIPGPDAAARRPADAVGRRVELPLERADVRRSPGYVVVMINRRGSTGFGQKFTDDITSTGAASRSRI